MTTNPLASKGGTRLAATLLLGTMLATAAQAETLTVTDIVPAGAQQLYKVSIPTVEVTDGNLTEADIRALFAVASLDDLKKWTSITAKSVVIPTITITVSVTDATASSPPVEETITITDLQLLDVVDGVAASTQVGGASISAKSATEGAPEVAFTYGRMTTGLYDIGAQLAQYGIGDITGTEMKPVYQGMTVEGAGFTVGDVVRCTVGPVNSGDMFAKPSPTALQDVLGALERLEASTKTTPPGLPAPADIKSVVHFYTGILTAFRSDPTTVGALECAGTDPTTGKTFSVNAGGFGMGGFEPGVYPDIAVSDFAFDGGTDGFLKFGNFTWKQMDLNGPIAALNAAETLDEAWFAANWRKLIPSMDGLSLTDLSYDVPNPGAPSARIAGTIGLFDVTLGKYVAGLPSEISLALDNTTVPLPPEVAASPVAGTLAARGITSVTSDTHVKLHWDEASNTIVIDELLSDADEFFRIAVTGTIGNATPALFSEDESEMMAAGLGLTVKELTIDIEDYGLYGLILTASSAESGQPLQATRTALSGMAQGMTLAILGSDETSLAAVGELGKFLSGANSKVSITLTAKDGAGLSLADFSALERDPTVLAGKVTVTAVASGDPVPVIEAPAPAAPAAPAESPSLEDQKRDLKAPPRSN